MLEYGDKLHKYLRAAKSVTFLELLAAGHSSKVKEKML